MNPSCFSINIFFPAASRQSATNHFQTAALCRDAAMFASRQTKSPDSRSRRGDKVFVLLLIFPKPMVLELELAPAIET
jgi:hypothetical protein